MKAIVCGDCGALRVSFSASYGGVKWAQVATVSDDEAECLAGEALYCRVCGVTGTLRAMDWPPKTP